MSVANLCGTLTTRIEVFLHIGKIEKNVYMNYSYVLSLEVYTAAIQESVCRNLIYQMR